MKIYDSYSNVEIFIDLLVLEFFSSFLILNESRVLVDIEVGKPFMFKRIVQRYTSVCILVEQLTDEVFALT